MERKTLSEHIFVSSDPRPLQNTLRANLSKRLGYSVDDADPCYLIGCSLLPTLTQTLAACDAGFKGGLLAFATGEQLDAIGESEGVIRRTGSERAQLTMILTIQNAYYLTTDIEWDIRVRFKIQAREGQTTNFYDTDYVYSGSGTILKSSLNLNQGATNKVAVTLTAEFEGEGYMNTTGRYLEEFDMGFDWATVEPVVVSYSTEQYISRQGYTAETDDEYAQRIYQSRKARKSYGSQTWYLDMIQSYIPEVTDAKSYIIESVMVQGETGLVLMTASEDGNGDAIREKAREILEQHAFAGDRIRVIKPRKRGLSVDGSGEPAEAYIDIYYSPSRATGTRTDIVEQASRIATDFIWEQSKKLSWVFDNAELTARLKAAIPSITSSNFILVNSGTETAENPYSYWSAEQVSIYVTKEEV